MTNTITFCLISTSNLKTGRFETRRFETWHFVNLTFCKPDVLKPDVLKPNVLKPDVLKPDVLWVYHIDWRAGTTTLCQSRLYLPSQSGTKNFASVQWFSRLCLLTSDQTSKRRHQRFGLLTRKFINGYGIRDPGWVKIKIRNGDPDSGYIPNHIFESLETIFLVKNT